MLTIYLRKNFGYGYFVVKTVLPSPFSAQKWLHGRKAKKTASKFIPTDRPKDRRKRMKHFHIFREYLNKYSYRGQ